jgi:hypothetical protein
MSRKICREPFASASLRAQHPREPADQEEEGSELSSTHTTSMALPFSIRLSPRPWILQTLGAPQHTQSLYCTISGSKTTQPANEAACALVAHLCEASRHGTACCSTSHLLPLPEGGFCRALCCRRPCCCCLSPLPCAWHPSRDTCMHHGAQNECQECLRGLSGASWFLISKIG